MGAWRNQLKELSENRVLRHILFWLVISAFYAVLAGLFLDPWYEPLVNKIGYLPAQLLAAYTLIYYLIPRYLDQRKIGWFVLGLIVLTYVATVLARIMKVYWYETVLGEDLPKNPILEILINPTPLTYQYYWWIYPIPLLMLVIKYVRQHFREKQRIAILEKEKVQAELSFLKAQIHPHFLFNTLNNLYTLTLDKSDDAPPVIKKLSGMLHYMMHYAGQPTVLISREIQLIQDYMELEKLRYGDRLDLQFHCEMDDPSAKIAPLILLSLVENAFKHGASGDPGQPFIQIRLSVKDHFLSFQVKNSKPPILQNDPRKYKKGIGSRNVQRQLALIYPDAHTIDIQETSHQYEVTLTIKLNETAINRLIPAPSTQQKDRSHSLTPAQTDAYV